jgi:PAS domain S-box-containing protein
MMGKKKFSIVAFPQKSNRLSKKACALFEYFPTPVLLIDKSWKICKVNKAALKVYGYTKAEMCAMNVKQLFASGEINVIPLNSVKETVHRRKDGKTFPVEVKSYPLSFCWRERFLLIIQDITKRREAEQKAQTEETNLKLILDNVPVGIGIYEQTGKLVDCNNALAEILGYQKTELQQMNIRDYTHPEDVLISEKWRKSFFEGTIHNYSIEKRYIKKDGSIIWANINVARYYYADAKASRHCVVVVEDITARKKIEYLLRHNKVPINVILYGKQSVLTEGMRYILQTSRELNLVGHVFSPEDCYVLLENRFVDIVLIDEGTAGQDALLLRNNLDMKFPGVKVAVLGFSEQEGHDFDQIPYFRLQEHSLEELVLIIKSLKDTDHDGPISNITAQQKMRNSSLLDTLTEREKQILYLLALGKTNKEIGREIHLSHSTVRNYVSSILRKLNLPNRTAAAAVYNDVVKKV